MMKNNNKIKKANNQFILIIIINIFLISNLIFAASVIYQPQKENEVETSFNEFSINETPPPFEPHEEPKELPTESVRVAENLKKFGEISSKNSKAVIIMEEANEDAPITQDSIKYIKHTQSITVVPDGSYTWQKSGTIGKWTLGIFNTDLQKRAENGFYQVDGKTYYFDKDGYMYVGKIMDDRDILYIFSETGEMIYKGIDY